MSPSRKKITIQTLISLSIAITEGVNPFYHPTSHLTPAKKNKEATSKQKNNEPPPKKNPLKSLTISNKNKTNNIKTYRNQT